MITFGFVPSYSDAVVNDSYFYIKSSTALNQRLIATYIAVMGASGDIVWENAQGDPQWLPGCLLGQQYIIGAARILSSATVRGTSRTTTATGLVWLSVGTQFNTP